MDAAPAFVSGDGDSERGAAGLILSSVPQWSCARCLLAVVLTTGCWATGPEIGTEARLISRDGEI